MTTKEYLEQVTDIKARIKALEKCIELAGDDKDKALQKTLEDIKAEFVRFEGRVTQEINSLKNSKYAAVLLYKYIGGLTWEQIAEELDKDPDYVRKELHSKALISFEKKYPETPENPRKSPVIFD